MASPPWRGVTPLRVQQDNKACSFVLIHNWPPAACHHTHSVDEWTPYTAPGRHIYPSKEEAEYTAVLAYAIAVSASWWAARVGVAKLHVPRMPQFHTVGRREHWLDTDPRALREWAMVPLAVSLGLTAALQSRPGLPVRATVEAKQVAPDQLESGCIYGIQSIPQAVSLPMMSQETLVLAFRKLFPAAWFDKYQFAMVEDLINAPPFSCFPQWLASRGEAWAGLLGPHLAAGSVRQLARIGEGQQVGAVAHRAALPPLLPFNLSPDAHFQQALSRAQQPLPFEDLPIELQRRWSGVTAHLRSFQEPEVRVVTQQRDIGLLALLLVLTSWADTSLPFGLVKGLPAVGYAPPYGIFPQQPAKRLSMEDVLQGWQSHNAHLIAQLKPGKHDEFLLTQSIEDATNGFCTFPLTSTQLQTQIQGQAHRLIPRCVITQSSGKQRVIDNGDTGGQSELSSDANKLTLFCPMSRGESLGCVVVWWHHEWQAPAFQLYTGLLFGLPLAVTSFNRLSRVLESLSRRLGYVLVSFYFDDATITDVASAQGSGQWAANQICKLVGSPFATEKQQTMQQEGTFLGLTHDLSLIAETAGGVPVCH
eukprot:s50_g43.t1